MLPAANKSLSRVLGVARKGRRYPNLYPIVFGVFQGLCKRFPFLLPDSWHLLLPSNLEYLAPFLYDAYVFACGHTPVQITADTKKKKKEGNKTKEKL